MPFKQIGFTTDPRVNNGAPVPLYDMGDRYNTVEGWNALVLRISIENFTRAYGRPPTCDQEALAYNRARCDMLLKGGAA